MNKEELQAFDDAIIALRLDDMNHSADVMQSLKSKLTTKQEAHADYKDPEEWDILDAMVDLKESQQESVTDEETEYKSFEKFWDNSIKNDNWTTLERSASFMGWMGAKKDKLTTKQESVTDKEELRQEAKEYLSKRDWYNEKVYNLMADFAESKLTPQANESR